MPVGDTEAGIVALSTAVPMSALILPIVYAPVPAFIETSTPVSLCTVYVQLLVLSVEPTNTLNCPPAFVKLAPLPSLAVDTTCAELVKKAVVESEPDLIPKIVTESEAFKVPPLPSLKKTVIVVVPSAAGSFESGKLNVAETFPEATEVAAVSLPPFIEKVYVGVPEKGVLAPDIPNPIDTAIVAAIKV